MESTHAENKMGYLPIRSLIIKMSLPMMVSMLVLATYNVVDSIYVSRISESALTAVSKSVREKRIPPLPTPCFWPFAEAWFSRCFSVCSTVP